MRYIQVYMRYIQVYMRYIWGIWGIYEDEEAIAMVMYWSSCHITEHHPSRRSFLCPLARWPEINLQLPKKGYFLLQGQTYIFMCKTLSTPNSKLYIFQPRISHIGNCIYHMWWNWVLAKTVKEFSNLDYKSVWSD